MRLVGNTWYNYLLSDTDYTTKVVNPQTLNNVIFKVLKIFLSWKYSKISAALRVLHFNYISFWWKIEVTIPFIPLLNKSITSKKKNSSKTTWCSGKYNRVGIRSPGFLVLVTLLNCWVTSGSLAQFSHWFKKCVWGVKGLTALTVVSPSSHFKPPPSFYSSNQV